MCWSLYSGVVGDVEKMMRSLYNTLSKFIHNSMIEYWGEGGSSINADNPIEALANYEA